MDVKELGSVSGVEDIKWNCGSGELAILGRNMRGMPIISYWNSHRQRAVLSE